MKKYKLTYPTEKLGDAILAEAILKTKALVNILRAKVDYDEGVIVISVLGDKRKEKELVSHIKGKGVLVEELSGKIVKDSNACTDCGLCVGVCPTDAITAGKDFVVKIDNDLCVQCRACVEACPFKAIAIQDS